jgi:hypothetical protein
VSIDLVVEILDHYHGTRTRKLWLVAWAEKVPRGSRTGYCKREIIAARLDVSESRASHIARELVGEGTLARLGGGVWGKATEFELLSLDDAQGDPRAHPTQGDPRAHPTDAPEPHAQGDTRPHAQGDTRAHPNRHNRQEPSAARAREASRPHSRDPRLVLLGLDETVTDAEADTIAAALEADPDVRDPFAYLLAISAAGADQTGEFLSRMRRQLGTQPPGISPPPKPPWCGECDEQTRLVDREGDHPARCIRCHPLSVKPDDPSPSAWPPWCGDPACNERTRWRDTDDGLRAEKCPKCHPDLAGRL